MSNSLGGCISRGEQEEFIQLGIAIKDSYDDRLGNAYYRAAHVAMSPVLSAVANLSHTPFFTRSTLLEMVNFSLADPAR